MSTARHSIGTSTRVRNAPLSVQNYTNLPDTLGTLLFFNPSNTRFGYNSDDERKRCTRHLILIGSYMEPITRQYRRQKGRIRENRAPASGLPFVHAAGIAWTPSPPPCRLR